MLISMSGPKAVDRRSSRINRHHTTENISSVCLLYPMLRGSYDLCVITPNHNTGDLVTIRHASSASSDGTRGRAKGLFDFRDGNTGQVGQETAKALPAASRSAAYQE